MNKKGLAILMRARMRAAAASAADAPPSPATNNTNTNLSLTAVAAAAAARNSEAARSHGDADHLSKLPVNSATVTAFQRDLDVVRDAMHSAISLNKTQVLDSVLDVFSQGYVGLSRHDRRSLLLILAKGYDLNRIHARELMNQHLGLQLQLTAVLIISIPIAGDGTESSSPHDEAMLSAFYRIERNLRQALKPAYDVLFERLNTHPGGLRFLSNLRADVLAILQDENVASLRALDTCLKEKLTTWLSPFALELHHITWDDPASLLEKIVAYEAVHPISNLLDLKRRLGVGRRCFGYLHPAIPSEPLIFIEVALLKTVAQTIQEVLWDDPPTQESEATCALFYSISSTQAGLAGINLGKFLIKRVITLVKRDMPHISIFATLSPIPGYTQWLLSKLASQSHASPGVSESTFMENLLEPAEESLLMNSSSEAYAGKSGTEVLLNILTSNTYDWASNAEMLSALKSPLMRLCARYLLQEKKRGKALDSVANFHLQNGAMVERINWMADRSEKGLRQSGGIMVNYVYRVEEIEENAEGYIRGGSIQASKDVWCYIKGQQ
ncbi:Malonyl-CoA decarboxylase, mitochondrial [Linum grandiflorum]